VTPQAALVERLRTKLGSQPMREVAMFGSRAFMVGGKLVACALKDGDLLVRVAAERHDDLTKRSGAATAEMGTGRTMGPGWIAVKRRSIEGDDELWFWLDTALDHNKALTRDPKAAREAQPPEGNGE
jgi:hypothetical protein